MLKIKKILKIFSKNLISNELGYVWVQIYIKMDKGNETLKCQIYFQKIDLKITAGLIFGKVGKFLNQKNI